MDHSSALADDVLAIADGTMSKADQDAVCRLVFDYLACVRGAAGLPWVERVREWASTYAGTGRSRVGGGDLLVPAPVAAFANATAAHGYELDDTHDASLSHPGSVVISAALAVAADAEVTGDRFLAAVAAGYEVMGRLGMACDAGKVIARGHHPTALFGVFGAATAASLVGRRGKRSLLESWGHALSLASGSMQFADEDEGTDVKRVHAGHAAHGGVLAAELAAAGISAPHRPIDGRYGVLALFGHEPRLDRLRVDPADLIVHEISLKPYACCRQFHSAIDALLEVLDAPDVDPADIRSLRVSGPEVLGEQHSMRRPSSAMAAQYSLPYVVGAVVELGAQRFDAYEEPYLRDPRLLRWADMLEITVDDDLERQYPEHFGAEVAVELQDGRRRSARVLDGLGTRARPFSWDDIEAKAVLMAGDRSGARPQEVHELRRTLAELASVADVAALGL